jgi:hypothetical protein
MVHGATDGMAGVEMEREIRARVAAPFPAIDFGLIRPKRSSDGFFGRGEIGPSRSGGNVTLAVEAFAEFGVCASDVFVDGVATALFIASEIVAVGRSGPVVGITRLRVSGWCVCRSLTACGAMIRSGLARCQSQRQTEEQQVRK